MDPSTSSVSNAIQNDASSTLCQTGDIHEGSECAKAECIVNVAIILGLGVQIVRTPPNHRKARGCSAYTVGVRWQSQFQKW